MRGVRGQATVEYVALVLLLAIALGGALVLVAGAGIGDRVTAAMRRALCVVTGGSCADDAHPCVVASRREGESLELDAGFVRLGGEDALLREDRADGTVALTLLHSRSGGVVAGVGAEAHLDVGGPAVSFGNTLRAAALARSGEGATYVARDAREAADLERRLQQSVLARRPQATIAVPDGGPPMLLRPMPRLPEPVETFGEAGSSLSLSGGVGVAGVAKAGVRIGAEDTDGERVDRRTGRRTVYLHARDGASGSLKLLLPTLEGTRAREELYAVTLDRDGEPLELEVGASGVVAAGVSVPAVAAGAARALGARAARPRLLELDERLDLTDPDNRAAAGDFLGAVLSPRPAVGSGPAVAGALRARLDAAGTARARTYALDESDRGAGGHLGAGLRLGGAIGERTSTTRLLSAAAHAPGGAWHADAGCAAA
jgi:hypothetical protein